MRGSTTSGQPPASAQTAILLDPTPFHSYSIFSCGHRTALLPYLCQGPRASEPMLKMILAVFLILAAIPIVLRMSVFLAPPRFLETDAYLDSATLNVLPGKTEVRSSWRNMGYWEVSHGLPPFNRLRAPSTNFTLDKEKNTTIRSEAELIGIRLQDTEVYPVAASALARKLIDFADVPRGGNILDIAHGSGDSLLLHLSSSPPPAHLHAITSQPSETARARALVSAIYANATTQVRFFTSSAFPSPGKGQDHPLDPMFGFLGNRQKRDQIPFSASDTPNDEVDTQGEEGDMGSPSPPPYDLVYILDGIYHFDPWVPRFLNSVLPALREGSGTIVYTDIIAPKNLPTFLAQVVLPNLLNIPANNLVPHNPKSVEAYEEGLRQIGWDDVKVEDWSGQVWPGLEKNLRARGGVWGLVGRLVGSAKRGGWKYVAVRARKPVSTKEE